MRDFPTITTRAVARIPRPRIARASRTGDGLHPFRRGFQVEGTWRGGEMGAPTLGIAGCGD